MRGPASGTDDGVDFAVAAFRADGEWQVEDLTHDHLGDIATLASALRRFPGDAGALAMVAIDEDFFVLVRVAGADTRVLLSDITAADEWELASSAVEHLGLPLPDGLSDDRRRTGPGRAPRPPQRPRDAGDGPR